MKINQLTLDDLAFLEKCCVRIMEGTTSIPELVEAAELLSTVRSRQNPVQAKPKKIGLKQGAQ